MSYLEKDKTEAKKRRREKTKQLNEDNTGEKKKTQKTRERNLNYAKPKLLTNYVLLFPQSSLQIFFLIFHP